MQRANGLRRRAQAITMQCLVFKNRYATGTRQLHQRLRRLDQTIEHRVRAVHHGSVEDHQGVHLGFALTADLQRLQRADL